VALERVERRPHRVRRRLGRGLELHHRPRGALEDERQQPSREIGGVHEPDISLIRTSLGAVNDADRKALPPTTLIQHGEAC
jgi:hypothetical protein